ncbi:MAG: leucyl aminopeptidase [Gammaproteobacteria bacterium]|jgi:leucyl aminopeptidase|nr:leucyl aminopeptidase [Gammaproteobacteria bacterium]
MDFSVSSGALERAKTDCIVCPLYQDRPLTETALLLNRISGNQIQRLIKRGDHLGKAGEIQWLHNPEGEGAKRILLLGMGKAQNPSDPDLKKAITAATQALQNSGCRNALLPIEPHIGEESTRLYRWGRRVVETMEATHYHYQFPGTKKSKEPRPALKKILFSAPRKQSAALKKAIHEGKAIADGVSLARTLGDLPANICTPSYLADEAGKIGQNQKSLSVRLLNEKAMEKLGMGALLSVTRGSDQPARLIVAEYKGAAKSQRPVVLVGKGVTFDSGGISLKPGAKMDEMRFDMCGAAAVLGTLQAVRDLQLPINLVALVPATENLPSGSATKPGDVVTSLSGQTIEILNTDAEGRLILCDALTYAERFKPAEIIDIATLTGACVVALGKHAAGLLSNDDSLANDLLQAGEQSSDRAWRLPLWEEYQPQLDSNFADMGNIGGPEAGTITAACFLSRFTKKQRWAHLDIAGAAWNQGKEKGATGRPVALLVQHLLNRCSQ